MGKIRLAVFGISETILEIIRNEINPIAAEIVAFVDNDEVKHGKCFMSIPVVPLKQLDINAFDFCLVTALSAYEQIVWQLIEYGVCKERIQPFITGQLCEYCIGNADDIDEEFIRKVYFEPSKMLDMVKKYRDIYKKYVMVPVFEDNSEDWFHKSNLISHACGGVVDGRRIMYTNSKEAFQYSMEQGFRIIECDVLRLPNGEWMLAHDYWRFYEAEEEHYTMLSLRDFLLLLRKHPDVSCLIDVKWDNHEEYSLFVNELDGLISTLYKDKVEGKCLKEQIVMEVYDEETIICAKNKEFNMIFTQYRNPEYKWLMNTVNLCYKYGIRVIAFHLSEKFNHKKFMRIVTDKNIKVFIFSTDYIGDYDFLRKNGAKGIFTNFLTELDVETKEVEG